MIVVGDIHGDLNQFIYPLLEFQRNRTKYKKLIYLGDYIDRGTSNVYIYELIKYFQNNDKDIVFLRGNHEFYPCTYDQLKRFNSNHLMYSFMLNLYKELKLPLIYSFKSNDDTIVLSHCYLKHLSLQFVKSLNSLPFEKQYEYTIMTKNDNKSRDTHQFKNIYGHEHVPNITTNAITMVKLRVNNKEESYTSRSGYLQDDMCIDFDASYGFRVINRNKKIYSNVNYIILNDDSTFKLITLSKINIGSDKDYNHRCFKDIMKELKIKIPKSELFNDSFMLFQSLLNYPKNYHEAFETVKKIHDSEITSGEKIYFDDVPYEFYEKLGYNRYASTDELYSMINNEKKDCRIIIAIIITLVLIVVIIYTVVTRFKNKLLIKNNTIISSN